MVLSFFNAGLILMLPGEFLEFIAIAYIKNIYPKYLEVILNRSLAFQKHLTSGKTKNKE